MFLISVWIDLVGTTHFNFNIQNYRLTKTKDTFKCRNTLKRLKIDYGCTDRQSTIQNLLQLNIPKLAGYLQEPLQRRKLFAIYLISIE